MSYLQILTIIESQYIGHVKFELRPLHWTKNTRRRPWRSLCKFCLFSNTLSYEIEDMEMLHKNLFNFDEISSQMSQGRTFCYFILIIGSLPMLPCDLMFGLGET